jgi:hypothetical protein
MARDLCENVNKGRIDLGAKRPDTKTLDSVSMVNNFHR